MHHDQHTAYAPDTDAYAANAAAYTAPPADPYALLRPLLAAEAAAEAALGGGPEAADLEQAVWLRLLERGGRPPAEPGRWVRRAVRAEARAAARRAPGERHDAEGPQRRRPLGERPGGGPAPTRPGVEEQVLAAEQQRAVQDAVRRLPGRCPQLVAALMSRSDPTYGEISRELGISQGSLGPLRSRCLGCLRTILDPSVTPRVADRGGRGKAR